MSTNDIVERLAQHKTLGAAPRSELEWLAARGTLRTLNKGEILAEKGKPVEALNVVLSGRISIYIDRGGGPHKAMEWPAGTVTGILPYSRLQAPPGNSFAEEPTEIFVLRRDHLNEMIHACYEVTSILVHTMLDRARAFTSNELLNEKMVSIGKLSAGLAHELNNPASAIERNAATLEDRLDESERAARALGAARLSDAQLASVDKVRNACGSKRVQGVRSPIEQAEREEAIADWLEEHSISTEMAEELAETPVTFEALDQLAATVDSNALDAVLRWAASGCSVRTLASEIQDAAMRISGLVTAIKGFTHMDQAPVAEAVDLAQSLSNTVAVLRSKARAKAVAIAIELEPGVPRAFGFAGELNQVWANLLDNALDAVAESGRVEVRASIERDRVVVRVIDDGPGIPKEIRERIFDPFFTTKPMGAGTGLGLDIVRRLVRHNDGDIYVDSRAGRTEFQVSLPIAHAETQGGQP